MNLRRLLRPQRGQGLVEFAVIFPIFGLLICAVVDGGVVMGRYNETNHAATVGARFGAVQTGSASSVRSAVVSQVSKYASGKASAYVANCNLSGSGPDAAVCIEWLTGPNGEAPGEIGSSIRVAVRYHYDGVTPIFASFGGWDVSACVVERLEQPVSGVTGSFVGTGTSCDGAGVPTSTPTAVPTNTPKPPTPTPTTGVPAPTPTPCPWWAWWC
jgi:hypothetical protein